MLSWHDSCEQNVSSSNIAEPSDSDKDLEECDCKVLLFSL